jgi:hypothetical protein
VRRHSPALVPKKILAILKTHADSSVAAQTFDAYVFDDIGDTMSPP